jgi:hypothetical protein
MNLESDLQRALRPVPPPAGFAARVMERLAEEQQAPVPGQSIPPSGRRVRGWRAVAAGVLLTAIAGGFAAQRAIERRQGERARDEVMLALRITGAKVRTAQNHVREIASH